MALSSFGDPSERMSPELVIPLGKVVSVKTDSKDEEFIQELAEMVPTITIEFR